MFVDENGREIDFEGEDGYHYYYEDIYCIHNMPEGDCPDCGWKVGNSTWYAVNEAGEYRKLGSEGVCQRVVSSDNGTPDDPSDDFVVNGLYCLDASTGINSMFDYRKANLEDAVEDGYYGAEDVDHIRAIMKYGYTWTEPEENLEAIRTKVAEDLKKAEEAGDTETAALLKQIDAENLTARQAANATGMAVWHYGNRFAMAEDEHVEIRNDDQGTESVNALYKYLISLTEEKAETEIINEEKFIDELELVIGEKVEGDEDNLDDDDTNDKYEVDMKFSLVVEPDADSDDLVVKVLDSAGNEVKAARIAGDRKEGETMDYLTPETDAQGERYYVLEGMQLSENADTSFNLKLEGVQYLTEGVYVFESRTCTLEQAAQETYEYWTSDENWEGERKWAAGKVGVPVEQMTKELYREKVMDFYFSSKKYKDENGDYDWDKTVGSQNFIGKFEGEAEVDVAMTVDLTFNVEESTVTTTRQWREESRRAPDRGNAVITELDLQDNGEPEGGPEGEIPEVPAPAEGQSVEELPDEDVPLADAPGEESPADVPDGEPLTELADEDVPLADIPDTGDGSALWYVLSLVSGLSLAAVTLTGKKRSNG